MVGAVALVMVGALLSGCTLSQNADQTTAGGGSIKKINALNAVQIKVGSKEFDEQLLLGQIAIIALQAAGASPVDKTNITGSSNVRQALTSGAIDLYWEYTGTGWVTYLKQTSVPTDPVALYNSVKQKDAANNVTWWARSPANDTYAMAVNSSAEQQYHVSTLSQYAALAKSN
ncbi:MAG: glycine/betaine ABC transporter substrate-binding protein, partial [Sciscionella sp.]|nr:glycine/betaine ABC transporter substrate-binding protein [Sciscionella sp.]